MTHQFVILWQLGATVGGLRLFWYVPLELRCRQVLKLGTYYDLPIPSKYPIHYIPVALDSVIASPIPIWPEWTFG